MIILLERPVEMESLKHPNNPQRFFYRNHPNLKTISLGPTKVSKLQSKDQSENQKIFALTSDLRHRYNPLLYDISNNMLWPSVQSRRTICLCFCRTGTSELILAQPRNVRKPITMTRLVILSSCIFKFCCLGNLHVRPPTLTVIGQLIFERIFSPCLLRTSAPTHPSPLPPFRQYNPSSSLLLHFTCTN